MPRQLKSDCSLRRNLDGILQRLAIRQGKQTSHDLQVPRSLGKGGEYENHEPRGLAVQRIKVHTAPRKPEGSHTPSYKWGPQVRKRKPVPHGRRRHTFMFGKGEDERGNVA